MAPPAHRRDRHGPKTDQRSTRPPRRRRTPPGPWKSGPIPVVGLIGGIGAGKSLAAEAFARRAAFVLDADTVGHSLLEQTPSREEVIHRFGPDVVAPLDPDGDGPAIDRKALAARVFEDAAARRDLEAILHPRMRNTFEKAIARTVRRGQHTAVVLDAAILIEAGWDDLCDLVAFLDAPREQRQARVAASRGWNPETLARREAAQLPLETKRQRADAVLLNSGTPESLDEAVGRFWTRFIKPVQRYTGRS